MIAGQYFNNPYVTNTLSQYEFVNIQQPSPQIMQQQGIFGMNAQIQQPQQTAMMSPQGQIQGIMGMVLPMIMNMFLIFMLQDLFTSDDQKSGANSSTSYQPPATQPVNKTEPEDNSLIKVFQKLFQELTGVKPEDIEEKIDINKEDIKTNDQENIKQQEEIEANAKLIEELKNQINELKEQLTASKEKNTEQQEKIEQLEENVSENSEAIGANATQVNTNSTQITVNSELMAANSDLDAAQQKIINLNALFVEADTKISEAHDEAIVDLAKSIEEIAKRVENIAGAV